MHPIFTFPSLYYHPQTIFPSLPLSLPSCGGFISSSFETHYSQIKSPKAGKEMPIEMPKGLPFSVDTWSLCSKRKRHHFLTHAHKDHSSGICTHFSFPIYSTLLTKTLLFQHYPQVCLFYLPVFAMILSMALFFIFYFFLLGVILWLFCAA